VSFREDGAAAVEWVASYLERLRDLPVLAQVEPGELRARLPAAPPEAPEPFANVLRDLDEVLLPGLTHWQSPRFFAYFANTGSEPGVLAELLAAGLNQVGILWRTSPALQELEEVTLDWLAQLLELPNALHGHIEDTASTATMVALAAARAARPGSRAVVYSEHAHSSVAKACRCSSSSRVRRPSTISSGYGPTRSSSTERAPSWRRSERRRPAPLIRCPRSRRPANATACGSTTACRR